MKAVTFAICLLISFQIVNSQSLRLGDCYDKAKRNYPAYRQSEMYQKISDLKIDNFSSLYYPELSIVGQAQYQSDVTKVELNIQNPFFKIPQIPVPPKDQYKIGINLNQIIWDGGMLASQKDIERIQLQINVQNVEVELYSLKQRINEAFFGILVVNERIKAIELAKSDLSSRLENIRVKVSGGVALETSADVLAAEIVNIGQTLEELQTLKRSLFETLSELINEKLDTAAVPAIPELPERFFSNDLSGRPEFKSFSFIRNQLEETKTLVDSKTMPKFFLYLQGAYAKPGLNMFEPDWQPYYIAGLRTSWNFWNWGSTSRENEILSVQKEIVSTQEESFTQNLKITLNKLRNDIEKYSVLMKNDEELIVLRKKITKNAIVQFENGIITATEYLNEFNAELKAKISLEIHKLEMVQVQLNYLTVAGYGFK